MDLQMEKHKILIVDDMPINIQILARALKTYYQIKVANSGRKALKIASSENRPDLILLDIMMPEMDGYEVVRRLKENPLTRNIPVIFITVKDEAADESMGLELGAVDYITKPFHIPVVMSRVKTQLELKRKTDMLEKLVSIDGLTNIYNRRRFDEVIENEWKRAMRNAVPLSLIMLDIDYFKQFNDTYGHTVGDDCLRQIAQVLKISLIRPADFIARYGGEEFAAVLPETDIRGAVSVSEKIQNNLEHLNISHINSQVADHVTLSVGVATIVPNGQHSLVNFIEAADKMLYEAKKKGRNKLEYIYLD